MAHAKAIGAWFARIAESAPFSSKFPYEVDDAFLATVDEIEKDRKVNPLPVPVDGYGRYWREGEHEE